MSFWKRECPLPVVSKNARVAIVTASFNETETNQLRENTEETLRKCGLKSIDHFSVPGSFELPFAAKKLIETQQYDAIIVLGVIVRGETYHFELVAENTTRGIQKLNLLGKAPVIFGVLACENAKQVEARLLLGHDFAVSAVMMINLSREIFLLEK